MIEPPEALWIPAGVPDEYRLALVEGYLAAIRNEPVVL